MIEELHDNLIRATSKIKRAGVAHAHHWLAAPLEMDQSIHSHRFDMGLLAWSFLGLQGRTIG
jgi:hypothetical protein